MKSLLQKIKTLIKRRKNAKKLGIKFTRAAAWELPAEVFIKNRKIKLDLIRDGSTSTSFTDIFLDDVYGLFFFKSLLPEINTIVDIGANQGLFAVAARNAFNTAKIYAYEPNPEVMRFLNYHTDQVDVTCFNEAVGLTTGHINIEPGKDSLHSKTCLSNSGNITQLSFKTVLSRINGKIDLLKLDCEGAEWEILQDKTSLKKVKAITLEYHLDEMHDHNRIKKILQDADFKILHYEIAGPTWGMVWAVNNNIKFYES